jgi:hypothetical protein
VPLHDLQAVPDLPSAMAMMTDAMASDATIDATTNAFASNVRATAPSL